MSCRCGCGGCAQKMGFTTAHYERWRRQGRPEELPPAGARRRWRIEDYADLTRSLGESLYSAAERMGISERTAWRYEAALRDGQDVAA